MQTGLGKLGRCAAIASVLALAACAAPGGEMVRPAAFTDGIVKVPSAYGMDETIARVKQDIAAKGIMFFDAYDQQQLAADADIELRPSTLLVFGNPALGSQFITSNPIAGLDWPVRLLITEDESGQVWAVYTDFDTIARRHRIIDRDEAFKMASEVIASITASVMPAGQVESESHITAAATRIVLEETSPDSNGVSLEQRLRRVEAHLTMANTAHADRQRKLEQGFWGRLDGS